LEVEKSLTGIDTAMQVFGVFEGGGAKGIAHVAAFAAAKRHTGVLPLS